MDSSFCSALREWQPLLQALFHSSQSSSPIGSAIHWVRSHGYPSALGTGSRKRANVGSLPGRLWRLVPELLAVKVVLSTSVELNREEQQEADEKQKRAVDVNREDQQADEKRKGAEELSREEPEVADENQKGAEELDREEQQAAEKQKGSAIAHALFRSKDLELLGRNLLSSSQLDFWVARAVQNLLSTVSIIQEPHYIADESADAMGYYCLPDWLEKYKGQHRPLLSQANQELNNGKRLRGPFSEKADTNSGKIDPEDHRTSHFESDYQGNEEKLQQDKVINCLKAPPSPSEGQFGTHGDTTGAIFSSPVKDEITNAEIPGIQESGASGKVLESESRDGSDINGKSFEVILSPELYSRAQALREAWLEMQPIACNAEDTSILRTTPDPTALLNVIKPWEMGDDITLYLIENLMGKEEGFSWSARILSYCLLPKMLSLEQPASRVLITAVLQASKLHPRAAVDALLVPLILCKQGPNAAQCDVINRTLKESFPCDHVSSFCEKIFLRDRRQKLPYAMPLSVQQDFLVRALVWSESVCTVLQNLLNQRILLDEETVDGLITVLEEVVGDFSTSLKFSNLLLCLVTKYSSQLKQHRAMLQRVAEKTNTFMTKSVLSKLSTL